MCSQLIYEEWICSFTNGVHYWPKSEGLYEINTQANYNFLESNLLILK
jgi:hypothetical protein